MLHELKHKLSYVGVKRNVFWIIKLTLANYRADVCDHPGCEINLFALYEVPGSVDTYGQG